MRSIKWCPEMAIFSFKTATGRERFYTEKEVKGAPMFDETAKAMDALLKMAKVNPNQWVEY